MLLEAGQRVDRYVLIEPLGEGGQGAVWKATDPLSPERPCALKLVPVHVGRQNELERVRREARALASLEHPSLVRGSALFEDLKLGVLGIAMEWVEGASLKRLSRDGRLSAEQKGLVLEHVARALDYLHRSGVVHRDVKLDNVLVRERFWDDPSVSENVKLVDLGIAAPAGGSRDLTSEGTVIGTLPYLAPELLDPATFEGEPSSPRIDVFAFGVMGWLLLSGRHPSGLEGSSSAVEYTKAYRARATMPDGFPAGDVDHRWRDVLARCLELEPAKRPGNAGALLALLGGAPDSVVVRPSRDPAIASPFDATAPAVPVPAAASAATVPIAKPPAAKPGKHVLPVFTLLVAAAIGVGVAMKLSVSNPSPGPSASTRPSALSSARVPERKAPVVPAPAARDAETESAAEEAGVEASAELHPCHAGCSSGRGCGAEGCSAALEPSENYALRVGRVETDADGTSFRTYETTEVCLSISGGTNPPVCSPLAETLDGGVTRQSLEVAYRDLVKGIDVVVQYTVPGAGAAKLAEKKGVVLPDGASRQLLCKGLVVEELKLSPDTKIERVVLFLDDPKAQPVRCP